MQMTIIYCKFKVVQGVINCITADKVPWIMQDTTWKPAIGVEPQTTQWCEKMEELTNEVQELGGVQLEWQRQGIPKTVILENILCPITDDLTTSQEESSESFEAHRLEDPAGEDNNDSDYTDEEVSELTSHNDKFVMSAEDWKKYEGTPPKIRLLMWNPENLAQRLDLDGAVSKGKTIRTNSPPLRSVRTEWAQTIRAVNPTFIIYNEASLPGLNVGKRKNQARVIQEAEQFHAAMGYQLLVGFEMKGHASHGGAIAVRDGIVITDVKYSFTGGRETQGRVLCIRVETEEADGGGDGMWIVQMYMHNSGTTRRENMMTAYEMWAKSHNEPVIIGSDTNSIDDIKEDVRMHVHPKSAVRQSDKKISLKDTLCMLTGKPTPNAGLEKAELFLTTRSDAMQEFYERNQLIDARGIERGEVTHTCHFAWMCWHQYVKKNKDKGMTYSGMPPCITARIDRFMLSSGAFQVTKMEVFNDLADVNKRNEYAQTEASNLSDHYAMAIEVQPRAAMKQGESRTFTNIMWRKASSRERSEAIGWYAEKEKKTF